MTPHIEAEKGQIAERVIMPGDPMRSKYIAENFLDDYEIVSEVRGNFVYTGHYKGQRVSVMASGMGIPSMGIYADELFREYDVQSIIRVGSCGGYADDMKLFDVVLASRSYSETTYDLTLDNKNVDIVYPSEELNKIIENKAKETNTNLYIGDIACTECFDLYMDDISKFFARLPEGYKPVAAEMESYALFYLAVKHNRKASCLLTVVDILDCKEEATPEEREKGLNKMLELALESILEA